MKGALILTAALLVSTTGLADDKEPNRNPDTADFSQAYLDQVKSEREKETEQTPEQARKEHQRYLKDVARTDKFSRK